METKLVDMALLAQYDSKLKKLANLVQRNYVYVVNDIVSYGGAKLKCVTSGTTSDRDISSTITVGALITDGTVVWKVLDQSDIGAVIKNWEATTDYEQNYLVVYNNILYRCSVTHTSSSTFDITKWVALETESLSITLWESLTDYNIDDLVIRNNMLYKCKVAHTSSTDFEANKWDMIGSGGTPSSSGISAWVTNKPYFIGDIVVYASQIYRCTTDHVSTSFTSNMASWELVSGVQTWSDNTFYAQNQLVYVNSDMYICVIAHTSSNSFSLDLDTKYWHPVVKIDAELIPANYLQVTKIDLGDNSIVDVKMPKTLTFCVKPPNILKFNPSTDIEIVTQNEFDSSDKNDFEYNTNYVVFDGTMHIKSDLGVNVGDSVKLVDGYVAISDTINFDEYKSVSGVKIG